MNEHDYSRVGHSKRGIESHASRHQDSSLQRNPSRRRSQRRCMTLQGRGADPSIRVSKCDGMLEDLGILYTLIILPVGTSKVILGSFEQGH